MSSKTNTGGQILWPNLITIISLAILIGTMIVGLGLATGWAIAGAIGLGETGTLIIEAIFVVLAGATVVAFWRQATSVEPVIDR